MDLNKLIVFVSMHGDCRGENFDGRWKFTGQQLQRFFDYVKELKESEGFDEEMEILEVVMDKWRPGVLPRGTSACHVSELFSLFKDHCFGDRIDPDSPLLIDVLTAVWSSKTYLLQSEECGFGLSTVPAMAVAASHDEYADTGIYELCQHTDDWIDCTK